VSLFDDSQPGHNELAFGIFDWIDGDPSRSAELYQQRLDMLMYADQAGFHAYHVAEHHGTPLGLAPSPNVFLAAAAARTRRLRLTPMVSVLPLYHPVRLVEEISMLDQLAAGRLELGIGRGTSPLEMAAFGVDANESRAMMDEALEIMLMGLSRGVMQFAGKHYRIQNAVNVISTIQRPYPPLWYPTAHAQSIPWAARHGMHFLDNFVSVLLDANADSPPPIAVYDRAYAKHRFDAGRLNGHVRSPRRGFVRHVVVSESCADAEAVARRAYEVFLEHFNCVAVNHGAPPFLRMTYDEFTGRGLLLVGDVDSVTDQLNAQLDLNGGDYFVGTFAFGNMRTEDVLQSLMRFATQVMPRVRGARHV
jgi:alkanesulfonate monooxygenase SsuD/methylene tetrahydromethanopterin reductase-like flavin-dependent oxidoreductase (luciferase family)